MQVSTLNSLEALHKFTFMKKDHKAVETAKKRQVVAKKVHSRQ